MQLICRSGWIAGGPLCGGDLRCAGGLLRVLLRGMRLPECLADIGLLRLASVPSMTLSLFSGGYPGSWKTMLSGWPAGTILGPASPRLAVICPDVLGGQIHGLRDPSRSCLRPLRGLDPLQDLPPRRWRKSLEVLIRSRIAGKRVAQVRRDHAVLRVGQGVPGSGR